MKKNKYFLTSVLLFSTLGLAMTSVSCTNEKVEATYQIQCEENKDYILKTDVNKAKAKDVVTISVNITNVDKEIDQILINGSNEGVTTITKNSKYTFIMPNSDVTISATLTDKVYENKEIAINEVNGFKTTFKVNNEVVTSAKKGDEVHVLLTNETDDRRVKSLTSNDVKIETITSGEEYKFIMIDNKVNLTLTDEAIPTHNLNFINEAGLTAKFYFKDKEVSEGIEGKEITIKLTLLEKYAFDSLVVNTPGVSLKTIKEGEEYTFIMPNTDVNIEGNAHKVIQKYKVLSIQAINFVDNIEGISINSEIVEGNEVTISFKLTNGNYDPINKYDYGAYINNNLVMSTNVDAENKTASLTFTMPSEDIDIYIGAFLKTVDETKTNKFKAVLPEVNSDYKIFGIQNGYYENDYGTIKIYIGTKKGSIVESLQYTKKDSDSPINLSFSNYYECYTLNKNYSNDEIITFSVNFKVTGTKKVTFEDATNIDVIGDLDVTVGSKVTYKITTKNGYVLNEGKYGYTSFIDSITLSDPNLTKPSVTCDNASDTISFKMPDCDVSIKLKLVKAVSLTYEANEHIESVEFSENSYGDSRVTQIVGGRTCYVYIKVKDGYKLNHVYYQEGKECEYSTYNEYYSFTVPTDVETIKLTFDVQKLFKFSAESTEAYTISGLDTNNISANETVEFDITRNPGYKIDSVSLSDGTSIKLVDGSKTKYSFVMPNNDVSLIVKSTNVGTSTISIDNKGAISSMALKDSVDSRVNDKSILTVGETITISNIKVNTGFKITGFTLSSGGEVTKNEDSTYSFVVPSSNFTLSPTYTEEESHTLTFAENAEVTATFKENYTTITTGKGYVGHTIQVNLEVKYAYKEDKCIDGTTIKVLTESGKNIEITDLSNYNSSASFKFVMPNENIIVSCSTKEYEKYEIKKSGDLSEYLFIHETAANYDSDNQLLSAKEETKIWMSFVIPEDILAKYSVVYLYPVNDKNNKEINRWSITKTKDYWSFVMPASSVTIHFEGVAK